jgi:hypothetical protein
VCKTNRTRNEKKKKKRFSAPSHEQGELGWVEATVGEIGWGWGREGNVAAAGGGLYRGQGMIYTGRGEARVSASIITRKVVPKHEGTHPHIFSFLSL